METPTRIKDIEDIICEAANVTREEVYSHDRHKPLVQARHAIWLLLHEHLNYPYAEIARLYSRDHTTIIHGVKRINKTDIHLAVIKGIRKVAPELLIPDVKRVRITPGDWSF